MTTSEGLPVGAVHAKRSVAVHRVRFFYAASAVLLLVLMFLGFQRFYLHGGAYPARPLTPPIRTLLILHGVAMSAWMILFVVQAMLIETRKHRVHMKLGLIGAVLAALIVLLGIRVGIESARVNPPDLRLWGLSPKQFMTVPLTAIVTFGVMVGLGIWNRKRPAAHRPMMLLATLAIIPAAMDRIDAIKNLYAGTVWGTIFGPFFSMLVVGLILVLLHWALTRSLNRWLTIGYAALVVSSALVMQLAPTQAWDRFATLLLR